MLKNIVCALMLTMTGSPAAAATYDLVADYEASVFTYGYATLSYVNNGAAAFNAFTTTHSSGCFGASNLSCHNNGSTVLIPMVGHVSSGTYAGNFITVPSDVLLRFVDSDTIVRFTAPAAGTYVIDGRA